MERKPGFNTWAREIYLNDGYNGHKICMFFFKDIDCALETKNFQSLYLVSDGIHK